MTITASAPGKLVLLGEYAVLEGAPAISMAVNRRAVARISSHPGSGCIAHAPDILSARLPFAITAQGLPDWRAAGAQAQALPLVDQVLRGLAASGLAPDSGSGFTLELDTGAFFDQPGSAGAPEQKRKLGLGSSAALTVALATAVAAQAGHAEITAESSSWLNAVLALHREFQGGQGSGVDVATSLHGGVIAYRMGAAIQQVVRWPEAVQRLYVWSGQSASTPKLLSILKAWRVDHQAEYAARMNALKALAESAVAALVHADGASLIEAAAAYSVELRALGMASGVNIWSAEHQQIAALATECGLVYKPCGAGGGDIGFVLALNDAERLEALRLRLSEAGFAAVPLAEDDCGLKLELTEMEEA